jgi:hypothetical protein
MFNSLAKLQKLTIRIVATIKEPRYIPFLRPSSQPPINFVSLPLDRCFPDSICRLGKALGITLMMHVSKVHGQCLPQLTWPIGGGHFGHSPSCFEDLIIITFLLRSLAEEESGQ